MWKFIQKLVVVLFLIVVVIPGCGKEEEKKKSKQGKIVSQAGKIEEKQKIKLIPMDDKDDVRFALFFPESNKVANWVKTIPVVGGEGKDAKKFIPTLVDILNPFGIESIATCQYKRIYNGKTEEANVCLIRARSSQDAYGMMSVCCPGSDRVEIGDGNRILGFNQLFVIKGPYLIILKGATTSTNIEHLTDGMRLLAGKITFELSGPGGIPTLAQLLQVESLPEGNIIFLRDLISLKGPAGKGVIDELKLTDEYMKKLDELLELGSDVEFVIGSFESENWVGKDIIWLAKYPTKEQALKVYTKYRKVLRESEGKDEFMDNTLLKAPRGRILLGCWNMEAESLAHLINKVQEHLP